jgi:hypothetical protein
VAELQPGEKSWQHAIKPIAGHYTLSSIREYLKCPGSRMLAHCKALGIELTPYLRVEAYLQRAYKTKYRHLTAKEAADIIARHRMLQGRSVE